MQVTIAVWAKMRMFPDDDVDVILSDHSANAEKYAEGLRKSGIFRRVKYIETKYIWRSYSNMQKVFDACRMLFHNNMYSRMLWDDGIDYDRIFFFNACLELSAFFEKAIRFSGGRKIPELIRYEEGLFSTGRLLAFEPEGRQKLAYIFDKLRGRLSIFDNTHTFMCFYPELLGVKSPGDCPDKLKDYSVIRIPAITEDRDFLTCINTVFDYDPSADSFPQKYIYFQTAIDVEFHISEIDFILKVSEVVGKDNLLVKIHPRSEADVYRRAGLNVIKNTSIPWEVVQLNHDFKNHVFVSLCSGSVFNITAMKNENIPVFMLYPMSAGMDKRLDAGTYNIDKMIKCFKSAGLCESIKVTGNIEDVLQA